MMWEMLHNVMLWNFSVSIRLLSAMGQIVDYGSELRVDDESVSTKVMGPMHVSNLIQELRYKEVELLLYACL